MRAVVAAGVALVLLAGCAPTAAPAPPPDAAAPFEVLGFQEAWLDPGTIASNAGALTFVGVDGVNLTDGGATLPTPDDTAVAALDAAHAQGLGAELLFSNFDEQLGDFSPEVAATLLGSTDNRAAVVASLAATVADQSWDGVMIDLESMTADDAGGLTALAQELDAALPAGVRLDIALMSATDDEGYAAWGYDLPALAAAVDRITIMTYDQHGTWSESGPVGALDWQRDVVTALLAQVPAQKVDLGIAGYGYVWTPDGSRSVSDAEARDLFPAATFDESSGEWTATLTDGTIAWWSDARSFASRVALARELGLAGVAVWSLGLSDPLVLPAE